MKRGELMYEGKAKRVYAMDDPSLCLVSYKDDATAFNGLKKGQIAGKGAVNNRMSNHLMAYLAENGIPTHVVEEVSETDTIVRKVQIVPLEVIMRNVAAGSLSKRLGIEEGVDLNRPVLEFCYKDDALGDPMVNDDHILALKLATESELDTIRHMARKVNELLCAIMLKAGMILVDFKIEFGRLPDGTIILADEISPDTCRLWDVETRKKLDKDRFRRDMGDVEDAYQEAFRRVMGV